MIWVSDIMLERNTYDERWAHGTMPSFSSAPGSTELHEINLSDLLISGMSVEYGVGEIDGVAPGIS